MGQTTGAGSADLGGSGSAAVSIFDAAGGAGSFAGGGDVAGSAAVDPPLNRLPKNAPAALPASASAAGAPVTALGASAGFDASGANAVVTDAVGAGGGSDATAATGTDGDGGTAAEALHGSAAGAGALGASPCGALGAICQGSGFSGGAASA